MSPKSLTLLVILLSAAVCTKAEPSPSQIVKEDSEEMNAEKIRQIYLRQGIDVEVKDDITGIRSIDSEFSIKKILVLFIPFSFIILLFLIFRERRNRINRIKSEWVETEAVITNIRQAEFSTGSSTQIQDVYELEYTFNQSKYKSSYGDKTDNALKRSIKGTKIGDTLNIYINPEDPQQIMVF
tara:strand:+ start:238 stop:786 length:549 start_codon:yes stop_codon:yes gene_type:complete